MGNYSQMKICPVSGKGKCFALSLPSTATYELTNTDSPTSTRDIRLTCNLRPSSPQTAADRHQLFNWSVIGSGKEGDATFNIRGTRQDGVSHIEVDYKSGHGAPLHISMLPTGAGNYRFNVTSDHSIMGRIASMAVMPFAPRIMGKIGVADEMIQTTCADKGNPDMGAMSVSRVTISEFSKGPMTKVYGCTIKP